MCTELCIMVIFVLWFILIYKTPRNILNRYPRVSIIGIHVPPTHTHLIATEVQHT